MARKPRPITERFWEKVDRRGPAECWLWQAGCNYRGYGKFAVRHHLDKGAHRIAYELTYGPIPDGKLVCHSCDTPACVNPAHLWLGSNGDNMRDRDNKERQAKGERHKRSKITAVQVEEIRSLLDQGVTQVAIARTYGLTQGNVGKIKHGKLWKDGAKIRKEVHSLWHSK